MLQRLKNTTLGKALFRLSKQPVLGWPIRKASEMTTIEALQPSHLQAENRAHNRKQAGILADFERETGQ